MRNGTLKKVAMLFVAMMLSVPISYAKDYNFGDGSTKTLTSGAWNALLTKDYEGVTAYTDKCISSFSRKAMEQQSSLTNFAPPEKAFDAWALNDVGVCLFIKGKALREQGKNDEAKKVFEDILKNYGFAQCWDVKGWFWKVAEGASDQILGIEKGVDFGDCTSETLAGKAWDSLSAKEYEKVSIYADKCITSFSAKAKEMQSSLKEPVNPGTNNENKEAVFKQWALNDVATCLFIKGKALREQGKKDEAKKIYEQIVKDYGFAQCWDPKGWFWSVGQAAKDQIMGIDLNIDFGDMTSATLATKAWDALAAAKYKDVDLYADKCIQMYGEKARDMQSGLTELVNPGTKLENKDAVFKQWALNDVATCLFIKAKALREQGKKGEAKKIYEQIVKDYGFAQCWDPKGWFWSVGLAAKDQITGIELNVDFGDMSSSTLTTKAWEALGAGKYKDIDIYVDKCIQMYGAKARDMQSGLKELVNPGAKLENKDAVFKLWALNDVGTCLFIKAKALREQGKKDEAKKVFEDVTANYGFAQCWDPKGWFWSVAQAAKDQLMGIDLNIDFGDMTSATLTTKAWEALAAGAYKDIDIYVDKCIQMYGSKAKEMQSALKGPVNPGKNLENKEEVFKQWALNDVATSLFIKGKALRDQGKKDEAKKVFEDITANYSFAQCWDTKGWFWSVGQGAKDQIMGIDLNIDFGDMTSATLTTKAWEALETASFKDVDIYADKCIEMYGAKAKEMQAALKEPVNPGKNLENKEEVFKQWALNDVATCLFIKGKALRDQGKNDEAKRVFGEVVSQYSFGQCWDTKGWFWSLAQGAKDQITGIDTNVDFGDMSSQTLTTKAWEALEIGKYLAVDIYVDKCVEMYGAKAREMQASLKDFVDPGKNLEKKEEVFKQWALNDVGTCLFIKGKALRDQGKKDEAKKVYEQVIKDYGFAQCWDPKGWFWSLAQGAKDQIMGIDSNIDFGDMSSQTLATKAWEALGEGKYKDVDIFVNKCLEMYGAKAKEMQAALKEPVDPGKKLENKEEVFKQWALNDVATCLFIKAKALYNEGKNDECKKVCQELIDNYPYGQTWDPQGWFWKPAEGAKDQVLLIDTGIDFGDYTSCTLTVKAWQALDAGKYDEVMVFCRKCIQLYQSFADEMQGKQDKYLPKENAFDSWALNDVGTCYFIMGEAYMGQKDYKKALEAYKTLVDKYFYSQCWDPKGWFWKPAVAARGKINKIVAEQGMM
jgi:tetratricopeptide (TPR) repeat protein